MAEDKKYGDKNFSKEAKKSFLEIVSTYGKYQEMLDRKSDISEIAETLGGITEAARMLAINEADDWFDAHTVKRNMSELEKLGKQFDKVSIDAKKLDQRLNGLYEDMGHILSRYYKIGDISEKEVKPRLGMNESKLHEMNPSLNKKVKKYLDDYLKGDTPNSPNHQFAVMTIMKGALTDANFHSEAKQLDKFFPKAKQVDPKYLKMADVIEDKGVQISKWAKWDGWDIIDAFSYYTNMTIGGGFGKKLEKLKESIVNEGKSEARQTAVAFEKVIQALSRVQSETWINEDEHDAILKLKNTILKMSNKAEKRIMNETKSPCSCGCGTCDKALTENTLLESSMAELDIIAKESNDFKEFTKEVFKEFPNLPKNRNSLKWLEDIYKTNESVSESKTEREKISKSEWRKIPKFKKHIGKDGIHYVTRLTDNGTSLIPVDITESVNEGKFKKDDLVYNTRTKTVGIVRMGDDKYGEVKTDADGNVNVDELEIYNPIKNKHQSNAKAAPSTQKEVSKRGLFNPFKNESLNEAYIVVYKFGNSKGQPASAAYTEKKDAESFLKDVKSKGAKATIIQRKVKGMVGESKFGYTDSTSSYIDKHNNEFKMAEKLNKGNEIKFYDELSSIEEKIGHPKYMKWLSNALRGYKVDMFKDPKIKNKGEAEEALFRLSK